MHGLAISVYLCNQPAAVARISNMPEENKHRFHILQWNCDCLTTKVVELSEFTFRYGIDIIALQEIKLGRDDPTPVLNGFDAVKRHRPRSGARFARDGELLTYIEKDSPIPKYQLHSMDRCKSCMSISQLPTGNISPSLVHTSHQH